MADLHEAFVAGEGHDQHRELHHTRFLILLNLRFHEIILLLSFLLLLNLLQQLADPRLLNLILRNLLRNLIFFNPDLIELLL